MPADNDYKKYGISAIGNCLRLLFFFWCVLMRAKKSAFSKENAL
jgi:hypothetical protein